MSGTIRASEAGGALRIAVICIATALVAGCGGRGHELERYSFAGTTLAVVDFAAPAAILLTGDYDFGGDGPITALVDAGSRLAKEVEAREARARLDSAAHLVDLRRRVSTWTLERAARYLGATPVGDAATADHLLEIRVERHGIDARGGSAAVFMTVEAVLLERRTGHELWSVEVNSRDELTPRVRTAGVVPMEIVTAGALSLLTVDDLRLELADLADFTADYLTNELREDLRDLRRR